MLAKDGFSTHEMQAVPAGWSTSALTYFIPGKKGENPTSTSVNPPWSVGYTVRAHSSSTFTTLEAVGLERTSLNLSAGEALLYAP